MFINTVDMCQSVLDGQSYGSCQDSPAWRGVRGVVSFNHVFTHSSFIHSFIHNFIHSSTREADDVNDALQSFVGSSTLTVGQTGFSADYALGSGHRQAFDEVWAGLELECRCTGMHSEESMAVVAFLLSAV